MRFTLISPRLTVQKGDFLGSGVPYWPIELATLAAFLRDKGHSVTIFDLFGSSPFTFEDNGDNYLQGMSFARLLDKGIVDPADAFILYAISYMSHRELLSISKIIRSAMPESWIGVMENSQAVTAYALSSMKNDFFNHGVDVLLCGEVYWNWDEIEELIRNKKITEIPNNVLIKGLSSNIIIKRKIEGKPIYPLPAWDLFPIDRYWSLPYSHGPKTKRYLPILTSRGCSYSCDFCVVPETNNSCWRGRSVEEVVDEIINLKNIYDVNDFQIEDLNPTLDGSRWKNICELLIARNVNIRYYFVSGTKAETIRIDLIPLYALSGCRYVSISPESGSPKVLKEMGKKFDYEHGRKLIQSCHEYGIHTQACFLVGHPIETPQDHRLSCEYLRRLVQVGLDEVAIFVVAPLAGSWLFRQNRILMDSQEALASFSPRGRVGWEQFSQNRKELIRIFFFEKFKQGLGIWLQAIRALLGRPYTKMENLPRRMAFIWRHVALYRIKKKLTQLLNV